MIKFSGVMPALVTPFDESKNVNVPVLKSLTEHLINQGAYGFYIGGATGEGVSMTREQREILAYEAVKQISGRVPAIVHIASINLEEAKALARHAEAVGADAISAIPPLFYKYSEDDVFNYYKEIASSVNIPVMIYYNTNAGFNMSARFAARLHEIDNVTAIKWTSSDYYGMMMVKELTHGEMNVINGPDEMLLMGLCAGADGGIGSTYNFMLPTIKAVYDNFKAGNIDEARRNQILATNIIYALHKFEGIPFVKAMLEKQGFEVGNCLVPFRQYTDEEKALMVLEAEKMGMVF
ncbi:MAG: dihydrodipicolinate synthase family protein [Clostridia bacterium]|nr:dihydrodipicolinate synthase family protein [Clostridia bacterium]